MVGRTVGVALTLFVFAAVGRAQSLDPARYGRALSDALERPLVGARPSYVTPLGGLPADVGFTNDVTAGIEPGALGIEDDDEDLYAQSGPAPAGIGDDVEWDFPSEGLPAPDRAPEALEAQSAIEVELSGVHVRRLAFDSPGAAERYALEGTVTSGFENLPVVFEQRGKVITVVAGASLADPARARAALTASWSAEPSDPGPLGSRFASLPGTGFAFRTRAQDPAFVESFQETARAMEDALSGRGSARAEGGVRWMWLASSKEAAPEAARFAEAFLADDPLSGPALPGPSQRSYRGAADRLRLLTPEIQGD